ncbi:MAG: histidine--tRNA ligase [Nitrososphaeria archaeon]|nr:histidine--tRNA ligase [Nitrososphaeria archaeon]NIN52110.1 histidine--tRNA ligase [Nitrososphaeria archaeon]NIQ32572.1 histidine--tRNA ligase [Nitrososphaeria archaeon]
MKLRLPRGLRDVDPEEFGRITYISDAFREVAERFRFYFMEPSTIEFFDLLALKSGPDIREEIYAFIDKGGRELALRFDLTAGMTRYVVSNPQLPKPIKLAALSVMWRYDEPQFGRYRSFYQWDVEIFGANEEKAGGEIISFSVELLKKLGLEKLQTKVSSRDVIEKVVAKYLGELNPLEAMRIIDKRGRRGEEEVKKLLRERGGEERGIEQLMEIISIAGEPSESEQSMREAEKDIAESEEFDELMGTMKWAQRLGVEDITLDLSVVRGIDYYDGVVFEVISEDAPEVGSLVGGGAYNSLVESFGGDFAAFGAAGGIERTVIALEKIGRFEEKVEERGVYVANIGEELMKELLEMVQTIRREGIPVDYDLSGRRLEGQLRDAERRGYRNIIILGKKEWREGKVVLKDFETGQQVRVTKEELIDTLKKTIPG